MTLIQNDRRPKNDTAPARVTNGDIRTLAETVRQQRVTATHVQPQVRTQTASGVVAGTDVTLGDVVVDELGVGVSSPSAQVHVAAGTATAGTAPIKIDPGILLSAPEEGALESDGVNLYFTVGGVRKQVTLT